MKRPVSSLKSHSDCPSHSDRNSCILLTNRIPVVAGLKCLHHRLHGMDFTTTLSNSFFRDELGRALSECGFGILAWILDASVDDIAEEPAQATATATVTLLSDEAEQGPEIGVKLTIKGYCVSSTKTRS